MKSKFVAFYMSLLFWPLWAKMKLFGVQNYRWAEVRKYSTSIRAEHSRMWLATPADYSNTF